MSKIALALVALACACNESTAPPARTLRNLQVSNGESPSPGELFFCKRGAGGTFTFHITASDGSFPSGNTFQVTVPEGGVTCLAPPIWQADAASSNLTTITVTEDVPPGFTVVDWIIGNNDDGTVRDTQSGGTSFTFTVCDDQNSRLTVDDAGPPPPVGKSFTIGPSSMEGAIRISAGDWVNGGYSFKFKSAHSATTYTVSAFVTITGPCRTSSGQLTGTTDMITVPMGTVNYAIPASSTATDWLPTGDANNVASWEGSIMAPASLCGGGGNVLDASKGAVYHATVLQSPPTGSLVDFRFKYRDPAAKGKPNTNCLDTSDPNRARADVCGASWSQTVTDP